MANLPHCILTYNSQNKWYLGINYSFSLVRPLLHRTGASYAMHYAMVVDEEDN